MMRNRSQSTVYSLQSSGCSFFEPSSSKNIQRDKTETHHLKEKRSRCFGFTLIEMMMVVAIIGIIVSLLFPALQKARHRGRIVKAESEVRELSKAWNAYWFTYATLPGSGAMSAGKVQLLQGGNPQNIMFMTFPKGAESTGFFDPWDKLYEVDLDTDADDTAWSYSTTVYLNNRHRQ